MPCALYLRLVFSRGPPGCRFCFGRRLEATWSVSSAATIIDAESGRALPGGGLMKRSPLQMSHLPLPATKSRRRAPVAGSTAEPLPKTPRQLGARSYELGC